MKLSYNTKFYLKLVACWAVISVSLYVLFPPKSTQAQTGDPRMERTLNALENIASELREIRQCQCKGK
jgi:hypothetical protein